MILGTAVLIKAKITVTGGGAPDSATITIKDPAGTVIVSAVPMVAAGGGEFTYVYQSGAAAEGEYTSDVSGVSGAYTAKSRRRFTLDR